MPLEPDAELDGLDTAKIFAAPDDPADWPAWREALTRWRAEAAERIEYDDGAYRAPEFAWTRGCFSVALVWLWDELLYDHEAGRFTPERFCAESEREFGGFDGDRPLARLPRDRDRRAEPVRLLPRRARDPRARRRAAGARPARLRQLQPVGRRDAPRAGRGRRRDRGARARARRGRRLPRHDEGGAAGPPGGARRACGRGSRSKASRRCRWRASATTTSRGRSGSPTAPSRACCGRAGSSSATCSTTRAAGTATTLEELHSAWLNGVGMLVWENVFGAWVGWNERDKELLRAMLSVQRQHAELLATGEWTPLAAAEPGRARRRLALDGRRDDAVGARESRRSVRGRGRRARGRDPGAGDRGVRRLGAGDGRRRRRRELPGARGGSRAGAGRPRRRRAGGIRGGRAAAADRRLPPPRDGHVRRGAVRRGVEAAAAAAARLRRGRAPGAARAVRDLGPRRARPASTSPRRARTPPRSARGSRPRTSGSSPPRRGCSTSPARASGTGPRASTPTAARAS